MNHKRGRAKNARAGCLLCHPHKANGCKTRPVSELRKTVDLIADLADDAFDLESEAPYCEACQGPCQGA